MATVKRISGNYTLKTISNTDTVTMDTSQLTVTGNLVVLGNTSAIESTNTNIWDNIITLNAGLSPSVAPTLNAGIEVDRGTQANVALRWNESLKNWQVTTNGSTYGNIVTAINGNVGITSNLVISNTTVAPVAQAGYNTVYAQTPAGGGSGLYVTNSTATQAELATKSAAIKYSIIFG